MAEPAPRRLLLKLVPEDPSYAFIKHRMAAFVLSMVAIVISIGAFTVQGLNFGIDFRGGSLIEVATQEPADLGEIRSALGDLGLGDVQVQEFGAPTNVLIRVEAQSGDGVEGETAQQAARNAVREALESRFEGIEFRRFEVVGPKVSGELVRAGTLAVVIALALMLAYISFRFEWQFGLGAVLALVHDVVLTIGMFALTRLEFNLSIIAAILTIVGYSMNDTVVLYDRVREKIRKYKKMELPELLDLAINKTLSRTVMTSVTTLLALVSLYLFGGEVLRGFAFAMIWGVIVGTYSSIFVAAPILLVTGVRREGLMTDADAAAADARP